MNVRKPGLTALATMGLLALGVAPARILADDKDSSGSTAKTEKAAPARPAENKIEAPMPLTERERWLLDRVEQLEKRVAELEAKGNPKLTAPMETSAAQAAATDAAPAEVAAAPAALNVAGTNAPSTAARTAGTTTETRSTLRLQIHQRLSGLNRSKRRVASRRRPSRLRLPISRG